MPTLLDVVAAHAATDHTRLAIITERDGTRTYGELLRRAAAFGVGLRRDLGVPRGSRICLWSVNRPEWLEAYMGAAGAGVVPVSANPEWTDHEIGYVLGHSEAEALVCDSDLAARALALQADAPRLRHVIALPDEDVALPAGAVSIEALLAGVTDDDPYAALCALPTDGAAAQAIMYTSGTSTGRPKAVAYELRAAGGGTGADYKEMFGLSPKDRGIIITPFFHGNGMGGAMACLSYGASVVFPRRFSASRFWGLVDRHRPTFLWTLVPLVNILMGQPPALRERTHAFRVLIVLGSGRNAPAIEERFGAPVIDWYGMTEAGSGTYTRLDEPRKPGSAGRPFPNSGMVILREDGTPAAPGETGEVVFRRDVIGFQGYLNDAEANAAAVTAEYFRTGDLGYFDEEGYFFFVDRKKDIVRRGGENISSMEVEAALRSHAQVAEAAVLGKPDPVLGERVVAFVVPAAGVDGEPDTEDIRAHVAAQLAHFKVPEALYFVDELPRTGTGKVEKFRLRATLPAS